jgi:hypothetical protein
MFPQKKSAYTQKEKENMSDEFIKSKRENKQDDQVTDGEHTSDTDISENNEDSEE